MSEKKDPRTGPVQVVPHEPRWKTVLLSVTVGIIGGGAAGLLLYGIGVTL